MIILMRTGPESDKAELQSSVGMNKPKYGNWRGPLYEHRLKKQSYFCLQIIEGKVLKF